MVEVHSWEEYQGSVDALDDPLLFHVHELIARHRMATTDAVRDWLATDIERAHACVLAARQQTQVQ